MPRAIALFTLLLPLRLGAVGVSEGPAPADAGTAALVRANNHFAVNLYLKLAARSGNVCFSPFSISTALALASAGANGPTATEMLEALCWDKACPDRPHASFGRLLQALATQSDGGQLAMANGMWVNQGATPKQPFLDVARKHYSAEVVQADFRGDAEGARQGINTWISEHTHGKISDMLAQGALSAGTTLALANAIYFSGKWATEFKKERTTSRNFLVGADRLVPVPMMYQMTYFQYAANPTCQVLEMPYRGTTLSMVVLLPQKDVGVEKLEAELSARSLEGWLSQLEKTAVAVYLPRFKFSCGYDLIPALRDLGMKRAFTAMADFSGMRNEPMWIYLVRHHSCVDVDEQGTVAAAGTVVALSKNGGRHPVYFWADHPFLFLIRDTKSGTVLFIGRLSDPPERATEAPREAEPRAPEEELHPKK
ncbi:MAG: serpin family protein [Planctomycetota bacterium]